MYSCYILNDAEEILSKVKPTYERVVCHHITHSYPDTAPPPKVGHVFAHTVLTGHGVECLLVQMDFDAKRPDGGYYHITLSLGKGRKPVESNWLIQKWLDGDIEIQSKNIFRALKVNVTPALV